MDSTVHQESVTTYRGLRSWLDAVDAMGQLQRVTGTDPLTDIGGLTEINNASQSPRALLFDEIAGSPPGHRVLTSSVNTVERLALTLRLTPGPLDHVLDAFAQRLPAWRESAASYRPVTVEDGPVREHVVKGEDIDLGIFPTPKWHEADGGRYIGTGCVVVTRDPDDGWVNGGCYRLMLTGPREVSVFMATPSRHGRQHIEKYHARGESAPVVVSLGHDPLLAPVLAGLAFEGGLSELDMAGAIMGEPLRVLEGEETGLPVPADSEIVLEGWVHPDARVTEGPHGEGLGYYAGDEHVVPAIEVTRLYHRDDPILLGAPPGIPPHDFSLPLSVAYSAMTRSAVVSAGMPGVRQVWCPHVTGRPLQIVSIDQQYFGHSRQAGLLASQVQSGVYLGRMTIVVDADIDVTNLSQVMWAVVTRADPREDYLVLDKMKGSPIDPLSILYPEGTMYSSRVVIDACRPFQHLRSFPPVVTSSAEHLASLRERFPAVGSP